MEWQWSIWVIVELAAVIGLVVLTFYSRNIVPTRVRSLGLALFVLGTTYVFLNAMEIGTSSPVPKFIFYKSQVVLLSITAIIWLAFILQYVHENYRFTPRTIVLLSILPTVIVLLVVTNNIHHILWTGNFLPSDNPFLFLYGAKPIFWLLMVCNGAVFIFGVFLLARQLTLMAQPLRGDAYTILFAAIVIMITAVIEASRVDRYTPYPISALTVGFTIAFILIEEGFRHLRSINIRPMAEQAAIEGLTDAFIVVDKDNRVFYMNTSAEELTGCSLTNAYLQPLRELLPYWPQQILNIVQQPSRLAKEISVEDEGKRSWYEIGISPINDSVGNFMGQVLLIHDITDRIKAEDERRDMERKAQLASRLSTVGQMAAGICHEINNPLTVVIGYSDLLTNKDIPENIKQELGYIREGGHRVADIVRQLLAFARNMQPTRTMVDINDIVSQTLRLREHQLRIANINVLTELAPNLPHTLADPGQIQQVFLNIVLNAETEMKSAHGQGTLMVKTEWVNDTIRISFKDNGPGISTENLSNIFDPFFTTRKIGEGTGLGLSVCHGIITEHNGRIYAQSQLDNGATFIVELPIVSEPAAAQMPIVADKETQQVCTRLGSILIIDDDQLLLKFLEEFLITKGYDVDAIDNANDALKVFTSKRHNIILMDLLMPDMSGIELYQRFQRMDKSVGSRVLIITGDTLGKPTRAFLQRTGVPYIEKPFDTDALMIKLDEIMSRNR